MSKDEFIKLVGIDWDDISDDDYSIVEYVYSRHPAINSKEDIANIWNLPNGMMIIRDMVETARLYEAVEKTYFEYMRKTNEARQAMETIKFGHPEKAREYLKKYWGEE